MKRLSRIFISVILVAVTALGFSGCSEMGGTGAQATAIGVGHVGGGAPPTIIEVTVVVNSASQATKVQFDELFPVSYAAQAAAPAQGASVPANQFAIIPDSINPNSTEPAKAYYYKYLFIGGIKFTAVPTTVEASKKVNGVDTAYQATTVKYTGEKDGVAIADLAAYCADFEKGAQWYYDNFIAKQCLYGDKDGAVSTSAFVCAAQGSMRKRYSKYWSANASGGIGQFSGLGIQGNWDALENYILAYGFDDITADSVKKPADTTGKLYVEINGVQTGATMSADAILYLNVAKDAYNKAVANLGK